MLTLLQRLLAYTFNACLVLLSIYLVWGWITIADVRARCEQKGYDFENVLASLASKDPAMDFKGKSITVTYPKDDSAFRRLKLVSEYMSYSSEKVASATQPDIHFRFVRIAYLDPFIWFTENVTNVLFTFGAGYLMGTIIVVLRLLRRRSLTLSYKVLRPLAGGLVASALFIIVLSGGKLFWSDVAHVNPISLGILAAIGAMSCERFEDILKRTAIGKAETGEDD